MLERIRQEMCRFMAAAAHEREMQGRPPLFEEPLVGVATADDPLFASYKAIIGEFHLTPQELVAESVGAAWTPRSVLCWVLPIQEAARVANRAAVSRPAREWAEVRSRGEECNVALRRRLTAFIEENGGRALAPQLSPLWRRIDDTPAGIASNWSERHAAYAAGLGTFSLSDALITERGTAHRIGSLITDLALPPTLRSYREYREHCLFFRNDDRRCGVCIGRCPAGALSKEGHDKQRCREFLDSAALQALKDEFGAAEVGCGLCQTKVPCEHCIP